MAGWACPHCTVVNEDGFDLCYACGTGRDGEPAGAGFRREGTPPADPAARALDCLRCRAPMRFAGRRRLHDSSVATAVLLGEFFVDRQVVDAYACADCGKLELFLPQD